MSRYESQRAKKTPPYIALKDVRHALGLTLDQVIGRIAEETGREYTRGFLSAIENGHRGASAQALDDIALAFGLPAGACTTNYAPRAAATDEAVA